MSEIPTDLVDSLLREPSPVVVGHVTPDADCLAAMLALKLGIEHATGRPVRCALPPGSVSQKLAFMLELAPVEVAGADQCRSAERLVVCDTAKRTRMNLPDSLQKDESLPWFIINIDHHASNTMFGRINWVDPDAGSTSELIHRLFVRAEWNITPVVATLLYAGIASDTVGFSLSNTTADTLAAAAGLVRHGADVAFVGDRLWRHRTQNEFELQRIIYDNTRLVASGRIALSTASYEEIVRTGCSAADVDDQVEIPRSLAGAEIVLLFTEGVKGQTRINLRSKSDVGVLELAASLGGGGHFAAAGAVLKMPVSQALEKVLPLAEKYLKKL